MRSLLFALACALTASAQTPAPTTYKPGDFQATNPNYPKRNPFWFEGRIDWDLLKTDQPATAWEFAQRGIHKQDDLEDNAGAIADYRQAVSLNSLKDGSCQVITAAPTGFGQTIDPPPCMFTARLRLANLLRKDAPEEAVGLLREVLQIDPLRLGVNTLLGDTLVGMGLLKEAVAAYQSELALSPVTELSRKLTGDEANNAHVHWSLASVYRSLGQPADEMRELDLYLKATRWHSDTYPWRILLARIRLQKLADASQ
jgi:tetratricopeptide (TPR) repeat protein